MPELVMPPHPKLRELHYLKESGVQYRREVGGRELASVCLFHGVHRAEIRWANTGLMVNGSIVGSVVLPVVTVGCWGSCGTSSGGAAVASLRDAGADLTPRQSAC